MAEEQIDTKQEPLEKVLWKSADKLRKNIDAVEYNHAVIGLIFLKYISDSFEDLFKKLESQKSDGADPKDNDKYKAGFCAAVSIEKVKELDYVLTPGRYVGLPAEEDDFNFEERFASLKTWLEKQIAEEKDLNDLIIKNLSKIGISKK